MREGFDKEIDSLLRRTARAPTFARGNGAGASKPDSHLDADELAAFAEGALPEAARMNAVSHLADCGECRTLAVNLTRAAGVETKLEKHALAAAAASPARESVAKRGWLASIFAPRTLRYVAPALVVCLVAAVSFIALRSRSGSGLVSLREPSNDSASSPVANSQSNSQPAPAAQETSNAQANANTATNAAVKDGATLDAKKAGEAPVTQPSNKDAGTGVPDGADAGAPAESKAAGDVAAEARPPSVAKEEDAVSVVPEPRKAPESAKMAEAPAPKSADSMKGGPPPPAQSNDELARNEVQQKGRAAQQRGLETQAPDGGARAQQRSAANNAASGGALASTPRDDGEARSRRGENAPASRRGRPDQNAASDSEREGAAAESREAAGHRFRRERGAWVDVNYKTSMRSTGVRRGTEAYRSLVADIPDIGRVAEQLGGEIIVVIHGRAYHIQ